MATIDALLNHAGERPASPPPPPPPPPPTTTTYDAADALTTLATLGSGQQYVGASSRELPSPTASVSGPASASTSASASASVSAPAAVPDAPHRRSSSFGSPVQPMQPIEPWPPADPAPVRSPSLAHYHHGSRSPAELQRRRSLVTEPVPVLAPIQGLDSNSHELVVGSIHDVSTHDVSTHDVSTHDSSTQNPSIQDASVQDASIQDASIQDSSTQDASIQDSSTQDSSTQDPSTQDPSTHPIDADTRKAIDAAKASDLGLRAKPAPPPPQHPTPAPSKKRPAPSSTAVKKKGTAKTTKPATKKRRLDDDHHHHTKARSVTPTARSAASKTARKGSHAATPTLHSSPAPDDTPDPHDDDDGDSSEDHNLYCICKKPDNHKWMIGCDGGCDDWFHGDCVDMKQADEGLVDKFICPLCEEAGRGNTTWKPMCRRQACRNPARVVRDHGSKYCSDDCAVAFMHEQLQRTAGADGPNHKPKKKKKVARPADDDDDDDDDRNNHNHDEPTPLGGVLRAKDLKALVDASPNIQAFRNLGSGVLSPPHTASPTRPNFPASPDDIALTAAETERLTALHNEKSQLIDRLEVLKDREKFVSMAKEQAARVADREKLKQKDFCGYDARLSWSDAEFLLWRSSRHGRAAFQFSTLAPTADQLASIDSADDTPLDVSPVCLKKRCTKHPQWQKLNLQDARFEELEVVEAIRECDKEERSVRERATRRHAKDTMARELTAAERGVDGSDRVSRNRDGWVEVVAT